MVSIININKILISIKPQKGDFIIKNNTDQSALKTNCTKKNTIAVRLLGVFLSLFHTKKNAKPIKKYKVVQTGANNQLGGLKEGFCKVIYQVLTEVCVAYPAKKPTKRHKPTLIKNLAILLATDGF